MQKYTFKAWSPSGRYLGTVSAIDVTEEAAANEILTYNPDITRLERV
jgi:hypothetical protein